MYRERERERIGGTHAAACLRGQVYRDTEREKTDIAENHSEGGECERDGVSERSERLRAMIYARAHIRTHRECGRL